MQITYPLVQEAEANASEDKERREKIDRKNQADSLVYQADKQLQELGDKVPAEEKTKAEGLIKNLKEALAQDDDDKIKTLTEELQQALYSIGSQVYQEAGGGPGAPGASGEGDVPGADGNASNGNAASGDDVIDAEFSETK